MLFFLSRFLWLTTQPKAIRPGLITTINAAYTLNELRNLIEKTGLAGCKIEKNPLGLTITAIK